MFNFGWWRDENNRQAAETIVNVLKVVVPAAVAVGVGVAAYLGYTTAQPDKPDKPSIECDATITQQGDGNAIQSCGDGDITIQGGSHADRICTGDLKLDGDGNLIMQCGDGDVNIIKGITPERHLADLERREKTLTEQFEKRAAEIRADVAGRTEAELRAAQAELRVVQLELQVVQTQLQNPDAAYRETVEQLRQLRLKLKEFEDNVPRAKLEAAQRALFEDGDRSLADQLLAEVEDNARDVVIVAAEAAFARGEIAEQEVRWRDAAKHYARSAALNPTYDTLYKAGFLLWQAGEYQKAIRAGEDLIDVSRAEFGANHNKTAVALSVLAVNLRYAGLYDAAEPLLREALEIFEAALGPDHPHTKQVRGNLEIFLADRPAD